MVGAEPLGEAEGLLIVFPTVGEVCITNELVGFAIDALFVDSSGVVQSIARELPAACAGAAETARGESEDAAGAGGREGAEPSTEALEDAPEIVHFTKAEGIDLRLGDIGPGDFIQLEARIVKALWAKPTPFSEIDSEVFLLDQWNERNPEERGGVYMFRESFHDALFQIAGQP